MEDQNEPLLISDSESEEESSESDSSNDNASNDSADQNGAPPSLIIRCTDYHQTFRNA